MRFQKIFFFLIFIFLIIGYLFVYKQQYIEKPIRADAEGYYAYLPAFLIYRDYFFENTNLYQPDAHSFQFPPIYKNSNTGKNIDKYPLGVSLLLLPFFGFASGLSSIFNQPTDGYSFFYQHILGLAGIFYLLIGLIFLYRTYSFFTSGNTAVITIISLVFATNLFHYATFDSLMSHVFSFSMISILLFYFFKRQTMPDARLSAIIGLISGLVFLVRNIDLIIPLSIFIAFNKNRIKDYLIMTLIFIAVILPQILYWKFASGQWLYFSYQGENFNFLSPKIPSFLFSVRKGLFFWSPIFLLTLFGIKEILKKTKIAISFILIILIYIYLTSSWYDWAYGASFGNRALIDIYPILGLFLAGFYERTKKYFKLQFLLLSILIFLNLTNMFKYWQRILPYDQVTLSIYMRNLLILKK